ncbi:hypothetical protein U1Q18_030221 [Sarracenia purpurea var. burkii]
MGIDFDPLDEILSERAPSNVVYEGIFLLNEAEFLINSLAAKTGVRFQPKAKPRPRKESSAPILSTKSVEAVDVAENELTPLVGSSLASSETKKSLKNHEDSVSGVHSANDPALVNSPLENVVIRETSGRSSCLHPEVVIHDVSGDWHPTTGKFGESADIFSGLESLDEFYSQSTTATVSAAGGSPEEVDLSAQLANEFATSCPVNSDAEGCLAPSETPAVRFSDSRNAEEGPLMAIVSASDDSSVRIPNISSYPCPEVTISQDPLTCEEAVVSNSDGGFHISNRRLEIEEADANPCLETLDNLYELPARSGQRRGKFQPKPKAQIDREKPGACTSHTDGDFSIPCSQNAQSVRSESEFMNEGSMSVSPPINLAQTSHSDAYFPGGNPKAAPEILEKVSPSAGLRKRKPPKLSDDSVGQQKASISGHENEACRSTRQLRKRINACELVDESEDEDHGDGNFTNESSSSLFDDLGEDGNDDGEDQVSSETQKRRGPRKSNKAAPQKEKPIRKRKKADEVPEATKRPPKKFSHSTRRKRRQVDKVLLETPEDEIDIQKLRIRDLILLAEYREQISIKEGKTAEAPSANQRYGGSLNRSHFQIYFLVLYPTFFYVSIMLFCVDTYAIAPISECLLQLNDKDTFSFVEVDGKDG